MKIHFNKTCKHTKTNKFENKNCSQLNKKRIGILDYIYSYERKANQKFN